MKRTPLGGEEVTLVGARTILVVDDDRVVRELLSAIFSGLDYVVVVAPDGEMALQFAETTTFGLAFVDLRLPGIKGTEVCRTLRERQPGIKLVLMSGFFDDEIGFLLDSSADVLMGKPFTEAGAREIAEHLLIEIAPS